MQVRRRNGHIFRLCGAIGLFGCGAVVATDVAGFLTADDYNPVADTISNLAVGPHAWIQDLGLWLLALGALAVAVGLYRWRLGGTGWIVGCIMLAVAGACVATIATVNEYAGQQNAGADIHQYAFYTLGIMCALAPLTLAQGFTRCGTFWPRFSRIMGVLLGIVGVTYLFAPTEWNGAYERLWALLAIGWVAAASELLIRRSRYVVEGF